MNMENAWKGFTVVLGLVIVPLFGWVWATQMQNTQIKSDMGHMLEQIHDVEKEAAAAKGNREDIIAIKIEMRYMRESQTRIETYITEDGR